MNTVTECQSHPDLQVRSRGVSSMKCRKIFQVQGLSPRIDFRVHNSNIANLERAMLERVYYVNQGGAFVRAPQPLEGVFKSRLRMFRSKLLTFVGFSKPMRRQDFPALYQSRKRQIYQKAVDSLAISPFVPKDAKLKAFVKAEKINFTSKSDPAPRVIQPRDPRYNVEVGIYLKEMEPRLYKAVARVFGEVTIFKGLNAVQSAKKLYHKWRRFSKPVALGLDASRFDQHVSVDALKWEHSIYHAVFKDPWLHHLLNFQIHNSGSGYCKDGRLRYRVDGCRMSGDMNTALGNCLIMCAMVHSYMEFIGVRFSLANNGDDCVLIFEQDDLPRVTRGLSRYFLDFGFTMKVESPVFVFEHIEFCQTHPVLHHVDLYGPSYIMVRNYPTALAKDCVSLVPLDSEKGYCKWLTAVGECGLALTGGIPVFQNFYQSFVRGGKGLRGRDHHMDEGMGREMLRAGVTNEFSVCKDEVRLSFWRAFGVSIQQQIMLEEHYDGYTPYWCGVLERRCNDFAHLWF